jgi:integrase
MPRHPACRKARGYTKDEIRRMLAAAEADPEGYCVLALLLTTGLRRSELLGLGLDTVDLDQATLDVRRTVTQVKGRAVVREVAKTKELARTLGIPARWCCCCAGRRGPRAGKRACLGRRIFGAADVLVSGMADVPMLPLTLTPRLRASFAGAPGFPQRPADPAGGTQPPQC